MSIQSLSSKHLINLHHAAILAEPDRHDLKLKLAQHLYNSQAYQDVLSILKECPADVLRADQNGYLLISNAAFHLQLMDVAIDAAQKSLNCGHEGSSGTLARVLSASGEKDKAFTVAKEGLKFDPSDHYCLLVAARYLLAQGNKALLWELCLNALEAGGWSAILPSALAFAATTDDEVKLAKSYSDPSFWIELIDPSKFGSLVSVSLAALKEMQSWSAFPSSHASVGEGERLENLQLTTHGPIAELLNGFESSVRSYAGNKSDSFRADYLARAPDNWNLHCWAVRTRRTGHESWHLHPNGWLSGVYYAQVPDLLQSDDTSAGGIEFGPYPLSDDNVSAVWSTHSIKPIQGQLLLFPSYFSHRTIPSGVKQDRIAVAFDVIQTQK